MARGFLSGLVWGGVASVLGASVVSVVADGPSRPDAVVEAPTETRAPEAGEASTATSVTDADLARDANAPEVSEPQADDVASVAEAGSDTAVVPQTGEADDLEGPAAVADTGAVDVGDVAPVQPSTQGDAPAVPGSETELSISTDPAQPPAPEVSDTDTATAFAPEVDDAPDSPTSEDPAPQTPDTTPAPTAPDVAEAPADPPAQDSAALAPVDEAEPGRPTIGEPAGSLVDRTPEVPSAAQTPAETDASPTDAPPIVAFAAPFENPDDKPLMSIVLLDSGIDLTGGPVGLAALRTFPYPLSFAVDATLPDAQARMADYRAEGFEVMALMDLPAGATAGDAEIALSAALDAVPESVAVMEGTGEGLQGSRDASDQITEALLASGHGLVLQSKGLNTAQKLAARDGVPAGLVFRDFDSADQTPTVIRRFLDQAAFRAGQEGGVIMVGRVRPDTISALLLWGLQDRAERVALAPISAVLTTLTEPQ